MASPFYFAVKGTTAGAPGTGTFTPNAVSSGYRAWSTVPTGWVGLVRFEDGSDWELRYCYWNGTGIERFAAIFASSTGSALTLTSSATAEMVADPNEFTTDLGSYAIAWAKPKLGAATFDTVGIAAPTITTGSSQAIATTNFLTQTPRIQSVSVSSTAHSPCGAVWTAANGQVLMSSSTAGQGGWTATFRFGSTQLPTGYRLLVGLIANAATGQLSTVGTEPSALVSAMVALAKDSGDTNLQFLTNDGTSGGTKINTGLALAVNDLWEVTFWQEPGSLTIYCLLIRVNNPSSGIYYGSTATDVPPTNTLLMPNVQGSLATTTGTAFQMQLGQISLRQGF